MYLPSPQFNGKNNGNSQGMTNGNFVQYPPPQSLPQNHQYQQMMYRNQQQMPPQYHGAPGIMHGQPMQQGQQGQQQGQQQQMRYPGPQGGASGNGGSQGAGVATEQDLQNLQFQQQAAAASVQANQQAVAAARSAGAAAGGTGTSTGSPQVIKPSVVQQGVSVGDVRVTTDKGEEGADGKRKRGRPKKLILDPTTNTYINSSHPNFKQLNKLLKNSNPNSRRNVGNINGRGIGGPNEDVISKLNEKPTYLRTLEDEAVQQLMQKKDRRGRPRKFPVEQTGITIKGIRVNGTLKQRKKKEDEVYQAQIGRIAKRERGRPKKVQPELDMSQQLNPNLNSNISQELNGGINQNLNFH